MISNYPSAACIIDFTICRCKRTSVLHIGHIINNDLGIQNRNNKYTTAEQILFSYQKDKMTATESLELLREKCLKRGSSGILGIGRLFRRIDDDRSKGINFEEFSKVCSEFNLGLDGEKTKEFFNLFDKDGSGSINFNELLESLRPPMSQSRKDCIAKAFQKFDKSGDGVVNGKDIKGVYNARHHPKYQNGEWTEAEVLADFLKTFDDPNNPDGTITSSEFLNYYAGVSASIDNDAYFDLMMRNAWKL